MQVFFLKKRKNYKILRRIKWFRSKADANGVDLVCVDFRCANLRLTLKYMQFLILQKFEPFFVCTFVSICFLIGRLFNLSQEI